MHGAFYFSQFGLVGHVMPRPGLVGHVMPTSQASIDFGAKYELMNMAVVQKEQSNFITELLLL